MSSESKVDKIFWSALIVCFLAFGVHTKEDLATNSTSSTTTLITTTTAVPEIVNTLPERCFYQDVSECPTDACPCKSLTLSNATVESLAIYCCNISDHDALERGFECANFSTSVSYIHIRNATLKYFNATEVRWRMLKTLAITDGSIKQIKGQFLMMTHITCLNFSNNSLLDMDNNSLIRLAQLHTLDLSYNNLTHLPALNIMNGREFWLDISGTNTLLCHDIQQSINKTSENQIVFNRENQTFCSASKHWNWFNSIERVPIKNFLALNVLQAECPRGENWHCTCSVGRWYLVNNLPTTFSISVDCSNMQLTKLPDKLPRDATLLNVSYNNITTLDELITNPGYARLREFIADHNNISSINNLEGSKFIENFILFSLRYNKIKSIPTYILTPTSLEKYFHKYEVKFGGNELHCDCSTAKYLKVWMQTQIVTDYEEVVCENVKGRVIDLEVSKMCVHPGDWTDYIYYIIATEIFLLVSLITKVSYDYWVFKTAGYLPWPANKMPKLPCDWLCET